MSRKPSRGNRTSFGGGPVRRTERLAVSKPTAVVPGGIYTRRVTSLTGHRTEDNLAEDIPVNLLASRRR